MAKSLPSVSHPTNRPNFYVMDCGELTVWFSYRTPIAFNHPSTGTVVRQNDWSVTTGKHLNYVSTDKSARISGQEFEKLLAMFEPTVISVK